MARVNYDFTNETVVVTGGSSGIGRELSLQFGDAGATVLVADVQRGQDDHTTPTHELIQDRGGNASFVHTDVADSAEIESVIEAAREYGGLDVMVNNAGIIERGPLFDVTAETIDRVHAVNVRGVLLGCKYAAADMLDRGEPGVILNTASINSTMADYELPEYTASKGAVLMITRTAALELASEGIRVNAIAPGFIPTQMSEGGPEAAKQAIQEGDTVKPIPMDRGGDPAEVAAGGLFLCTDAGSYVTGEVLHIDGGYHTL
ncbi:MAG: SDR family NAD(P)-dependent oxidoreductase [Halobellus sp.]|uniref:SDR family NAD(P)-dependent oxidoreductase n=1 Tax=Halobellus sp. TaxID=1979212 RepID=UPI0035D4EA72